MDIGYQNFLRIKLISKTTLFCDIMTCTPVEAHRRFGGIYGLHFLARRVIHERSQCEASDKQCVPPKHRKTYATLQSIAFKTAVRT